MKTTEILEDTKLRLKDKLSNLTNLQAINTKDQNGTYQLDMRVCLKAIKQI